MLRDYLETQEPAVSCEDHTNIIIHAILSAIKIKLVIGFY